MEVNAAVLAECFGVTKRRIEMMANEGTVVRIRRGKYDLGQSVKNYINYMTHAEKSTEEKTLDGVRAAHERIKMRKTELTVMRMEGQLHLASDVERLWGNMAATVKSRMLGIPVKLAPQVTGLTDATEVQSLLTREITDALNEVSGYDPADYDDYEPEEDEEAEETE
ncbi:putative terminase small subunit [Oscillibacter valericigenes Sjm18-20]|nr:putative terminase small subunit [Oscillibacter valericigenes Sjm18-20]